MKPVKHSKESKDSSCKESNSLKFIILEDKGQISDSEFYTSTFSCVMPLQDFSGDIQHSNRS